MQSKMNQGGAVLKLLAAIAVVLLGIVIYIFTAKLDAEVLLGANKVLPHAPFVISPEAQALHEDMVIADWHTDSLMWLRDLLERGDVGQVDVPRLAEGNVAVQVFTSVTRVPDAGIQVENNEAIGDRISNLAFIDKWPGDARHSLFARAIFHADKLHDLESRAPQQVKVVLDRADLDAVLASRAAGGIQLAALLGTEGLHPLEGELSNIALLYERGYRVMGLFHYFDNELGGSLHGTSGAGLSDFGRQVVQELNAQNIIVDVAHASEASVAEVLDLSERPVILSHTGMRGVCDKPRNISDAMMRRIADHGGLIGIGYFEIAICEMTPESVVRHLRYAIDTVGVEHVSLGSDYDGTAETPFDVSEVAVLTELMLQQGFTEAEIRAVMGENIVRFLREQLPQG